MAALAVKIKFLDGNLFDDDNTLPKMISDSMRPDQELVKYEKQASIGEFHTLAQSDPIHGSLGPPDTYHPDDHTPEVQFEMAMRNKKPLKMVDDMESMDSLQWAEKNRGYKLEMKDKDAPPPAI